MKLHKGLKNKKSERSARERKGGGRLGNEEERYAEAVELASFSNEDARKILHRLRRLEGQIRGVEKMLAYPERHMEVRGQISAIARGADSLRMATEKIYWKTKALREFLRIF